ncbi:MAG: alpha/beta hydrolase [Acidimicrobiia bacterium]|nr:alpha/beta hydrolase [Acidimicrobiia bacterium]
MFEGFTTHRIGTTGAEIHCLTGGSGPPLLLVHGYPQTHVMWHKVAPALAERFTVVAPDLRGYGDSSKPEAGDGYVGYAKRVMAQDLVEVMVSLGHESFGVAGHDRGGRVSYRMALDSPDRVTKLVTLDIVPTLETFEMVSGPAARNLWHWYFLAQPPPLPERMITAERDLYLEKMLRAWAGSVAAITDEAYAAYRAAWTPDTIRATCDDYRAGARIDCELDAADRDAGNRIACPMLALWGGEQRDLLSIWSRWATDVTGKGLPCGHFIAEEAPDQLLGAMIPFLADGS